MYAPNTKLYVPPHLRGVAIDVESAREQQTSSETIKRLPSCIAEKPKDTQQETCENLKEPIKDAYGNSGFPSLSFARLDKKILQRYYNEPEKNQYHHSRLFPKKPDVSKYQQHINDRMALINKPYTDKRVGMSFHEKEQVIKSMKTSVEAEYRKKILKYQRRLNDSIKVRIQMTKNKVLRWEKRNNKVFPRLKQSIEQEVEKYIFDNKRFECRQEDYVIYLDHSTPKPVMKCAETQTEPSSDSESEGYTTDFETKSTASWSVHSGEETPNTQTIPEESIPEEPIPEVTVRDERPEYLRFLDNIDKKQACIVQNSASIFDDIDALEKEIDACKQKDQADRENKIKLDKQPCIDRRKDFGSKIIKQEAPSKFIGWNVDRTPLTEKERKKIIKDYEKSQKPKSASWLRKLPNVFK